MLNKHDMSVTWLVSHVLIAPYVASAAALSAHHAATALRRLAVLNGRNAVGACVDVGPGDGACVAVGTAVGANDGVQVGEHVGLRVPPLI